MFDMDSFIE
jgi:hypothetical protein